jgi:1,4-alpha-glucan branching enzyme
MWLRDYHVDGLRYDMTPFIRSVDGGGNDLPDGWVADAVDQHLGARTVPGRILIAEDMQRDPRSPPPTTMGRPFTLSGTAPSSTRSAMR